MDVKLPSNLLLRARPRYSVWNYRKFVMVRRRCADSTRAKTSKHILHASHTQDIPRLTSAARDVGTVPEKSLMERSRNLRLVSSPNSVGIVPFRWVPPVIYSFILKHGWQHHDDV
jgi:hypothetical protein